MTIALDSTLLDVFGDADMESIFSMQTSVARWLEVERSLAEAQGGLGIIPKSAAEALVTELQHRTVDWAEIRAGMRTVGYPILPLLQSFGANSSDSARTYLHFGATTQDIMDTALVLQVRQALERIEALEIRLGDAIATLAIEHRSTVMAGRTHGLQAVPITFGAKLAVWLSEFGRHRERLSGLRPRLLVVQLFGAAGTAAALGPQSAEVRREMARLLGLATTDVPWHAARDQIAEMGFVLAAAAATAGKIAREIIELSRSEIGEVCEVSGHHRGASSTMPQKKNPILCESIVALSELATGHAGSLLHAMRTGHERAAGEWQIEWHAVPTLFSLCAGALQNTAEVIETLEVFPERMESNLSVDGGMVMAEALMIALAEIIGRSEAHELVYSLCSWAREETLDLRSAVEHRLDHSLLSKLPPLDTLLSPHNYLGEAEAITLVAVANWRGS